MSFDNDFKSLSIHNDFDADTEDDLDMEIDNICKDLNDPWLIHSPEQEMEEVLSRNQIIQNYLEDLKKNTNTILFQDIIHFIHQIKSKHTYYLKQIVFCNERELVLKSYLEKSIDLITKFDSTPIAAIHIFEFLKEFYENLIHFINKYC